MDITTGVDWWKSQFIYFSAWFSSILMSVPASLDCKLIFLITSEHVPIGYLIMKALLGIHLSACDPDKALPVFGIFTVLFVTVWLAETTQVISSPEHSILSLSDWLNLLRWFRRLAAQNRLFCHFLIGWNCSGDSGDCQPRTLYFVTFWLAETTLVIASP